LQPLENIRVLDITRALAGPYCTMMLGDLGAEVIKVEAPGAGDESRSWGPPFTGEPYGPYPGESAYFLSTNRNKQSIAINLKTPEGQQIIRKLVEITDVLVENFRTGVLDKMGLGFESLHGLNPRLVYCSISGYGRTGPFADRPGYDAILQAEGGLMSITGPVDGAPSRVGIPIVDITTGMFSATAILAALRARDLCGQGQLVDMSLFDAHVALLANVGANYLVGGKTPQRYGNAHPNLTPYEAFQARDRWFVLGAANDRQWESLCQVIGLPGLRNDPRFTTNADRLANREGLLDILGDALKKRDADDWLAELNQAGLPCGQINSIPEVFNNPQTQARELILTVEHPTAGQVHLAGFPYKFSHTPAEVHRPPPLLGEHTELVLVKLLGYSQENVIQLRELGAIG
jgi:crotonobetainyl-CoA:carnitine CoA-transferase CaiB-like acyl-CoA transferase